MRARAPLGLLGQLLAILLLTLVVEFAASTLLYERSARALVRDEEAQRLAEYLVVARALVAAQPPPSRPKAAERASTQRYEIRWTGSAAPPPPAASSELRQMRARVVEWEPSLGASGLSMRLVQAGPRPALLGGLRLADGSWLRFRAAAPVLRGYAVQRILAALLPAMLLLAVGALLFRRTLRPIAALARATGRIGEDEVPLREEGPREVRRLIRAFNAMQARIRQLIGDRTQALAAVGHDLRTPLSRLRLRIDAIADRQVADAVRADIREMEAMVSSLLAYLGGDSDPEPAVLTDVAVLVATIVDDASDRGGEAWYGGPDHLEARVRAVGLKRAIVNLVENALHYGHRARVTLVEEAGAMTIRVDDDGPGIPPDRLADAVKPFARLDPARGRNTRGLGLGLAIVQRQAELEGGALTLSNRAAGGLQAALTLPRH